MDTWTIQMGFPVIHIRRQGAFYILEQERFLMDAQAPGDIPVEESKFG